MRQDLSDIDGFNERLAFHCVPCVHVMERRIESVVPVGTEKIRDLVMTRYKYANTYYSTYQKLWMICISFDPIIFVDWGCRLSSSGTRGQLGPRSSTTEILYGIQYCTVWMADR